jgi:hypothetical protein
MRCMRVVMTEGDSDAGLLTRDIVPVKCLRTRDVCACHRQQERRSQHPAMKGVGLGRPLGCPQFNYEPFNSNSINICSWSWNYRGCWHQTCPPIVTRYWMGLNIPHWNLPNTEVSRRPISFRCLTKFFGIGQFARLLPSVEVVAVSQAPSPESNPNPPLPSTPWQSTTRPSLADRAVVRQKTLARPASARNELSQHFFECGTAASAALVLMSFIRMATPLREEQALPALNGRRR